VDDTTGDQTAARQHPDRAAVRGVSGSSFDPLPFVTDALTVHPALDTTGRFLRRQSPTFPPGSGRSVPWELSQKTGVSLNERPNARKLEYFVSECKGDLMLTLTENASAAIKNLTDQKAVTADGGLRISTADDSTGSLKVELTPTPEPTDQLVEDAGARVFLEERAAAALADKVLDAQLDGDGSVRFAVGEQQH
jgi:iron-sulfur cluster assembly protein